MLFEEIASFDNLCAAHKKTGANKRDKRAYIMFDRNREINVMRIHDALTGQTYRPLPTRVKQITDPKPRVINVPAYADRVLQQGVHRVVSPLFERRMIAHSYACRKGYGTHAAADKAQEYIRALALKGPVYFLKCDIRHFYASINHDILKRQLRKVIKEPDVRWLLETIIDGTGNSGVGLPLGAVTSQLFANVYLDVLDHFIKDYLGMKCYVRYMDDFIIFDTSKKRLRVLLKVIREYLTRRLALSLNQKTRIVSGKEGCDFCGYRLFTNRRLPRKRNIKRIRRRLKRMVRLYKTGKVTEEAIRQVWGSFHGYTLHCDAYQSKRAIWRETNEALRRRE
ncbi:MAG: reverse transcriptase/maturase family protein [Synergistaceae bacterium]|nr:reverse transcriptase/maturase family protein [Synergistaceae bacterium]